MTDESTDNSIGELLKDGWEIAGYSSTIMVLGSMTHSILLRKGTRVGLVTVGVKRGREIGRVSIML